MVDERPIGRRFTHVYMEPDGPQPDSKRLRIRVGEFFYAQFQNEAETVAATLKSEIGCKLTGSWEPAQVRDFMQASTLHDFLDALTVIASVLHAYDKQYGGARVSRWVGFANRALRETNVSFELDADGGVHPHIDAAFVASRHVAVAGLQNAKHREALDHFEDAYAALDGATPATGRAIREMHLAIEAIFKQAFPKASRIDVGEINKFLKPLVATRLRGPELEAAKLMLTSAGSFISAGHQFRHANGEPEPAPPSMDVTVWMLSQGTAFLRWLVAFVEADAG